jgi:hypothetical protein
MTITISGSGTIGGPTTFTDNVTLGTSLLATPSGATPSYLCRAWVNFNGTGTVAIRASGNVTSITDNGTGDYTINFTTAMTDANYAVASAGNRSDGVQPTMLGIISSVTAPTTALVRVGNKDDDGIFKDALNACISVFR